MLSNPTDGRQRTRHLDVHRTDVSTPIEEVSRRLPQCEICSRNSRSVAFCYPPERPSPETGRPPLWWRPMGTVMGVPATGSPTTWASRPNTLATSASSTISVGGPSTTTAQGHDVVRGPAREVQIVQHAHDRVGRLMVQVGQQVDSGVGLSLERRRDFHRVSALVAPVTADLDRSRDGGASVGSRSWIDR